jgi:transposase
LSLDFFGEDIGGKISSDEVSFYWSVKAIMTDNRKGKPCSNYSKMPAKKYIVSLTESERQILQELTQKGKAAARKINHARILLKADIHQKNGGWNDAQISQALDVSPRTIERVRQRFVEEGLEQALNPRRKNSSKLRKIDGETEAHLIALACSEAPTGYSRWTLRLLAEQIVVLEYVESISHETVRQVLKKTKSNLGYRNVG